MQNGNRFGRTVVWVLLLAGAGVSVAGETPEPLVRSPLAVIDTVKADGLAARAGVKAGDRVVAINGVAATRLEEVLGYRLAWEKGRDTRFGLKRGEETLTVLLPQGDWECDFRADLSEEGLRRFYAARGELKKAQTREEGRKAWEALAEEARQAGFPEAAFWLGTELGKAHFYAHRWKELKEVLERCGREAPGTSYWACVSAIFLGRALMMGGDLEGAARTFAQAGEALTDEASEPLRVVLMGWVFQFEYDRGRLPEARQLAEKLLADRGRLAPDSLLLANSFQDLGMVVYAQGDLAAAKAYFLKSLALKERLAPDSTALAMNLNNLGAVAAEMGDPVAAKEYFSRALAIHEQRTPNSILSAKALQNLAILDTLLGDFALARERFEKALSIRQRVLPDSLDLAQALANFAILLVEQGDLPLAKEYYRKSLAIRERLAPESLDVAHCLAAMSHVYRRQGDLKSAKACCTRALAIQERLAPKSLTLASCLLDLSFVVKEQGDLASASELQARALAIQESVAPGGMAVAASLDSLGNTARKQGDLAMAREYYLKALAIRERLAPNGLEAAYILNNLGSLAIDRGDLASARDFHLKSLAVKERLVPDTLDVAESLNSLGAIGSAQGDLASARELYLKALALKQRHAPDSLDEALTLDGLGNVLRKQGDLGAARENLRKAVAIQERLAPGSRALAESLRDLARTEKAAGALSLSAELQARAVEVLEAQRAQVGGESAKTAFSAVTGEFYTDLIAALLDTQRPQTALETLERSRARTLLEMVSSRYVDLGGEIPAALLERQRELTGRRRYLSDKLAQAGEKTDPKRVEGWRAELLMLPQKEDALAEEIRKASPRLAALQYPKPLDYNAMRDALLPGDLLVAYAVGETESYLFTLRKPRGKATGDELRGVRLKLGRKELGNRVMIYREAVSQPDTDSEEWRAASRELFSLLLGPVAGEIAGCERILLLPDGPLHLLPFSTLIPGKTPARGKARLDPSRPLGLQRPLSVQASLTVYAGLRSGAGGGSPSKGLNWAGLGDPVYPDPGKPGDTPGELAALKTRGFQLGPLPGTRQEIEDVARLFGGRARVHLGPDATKAQALGLPRETRFVHFACHGLLDPDFPMNSALALSPSPGKPADAEGTANDGLLQAWEIIQNLRLESDCVVLSACETGVGKVCGGEGILGLTRAFLYAGSRSVVVSLWPISDASTAHFMQIFYREILAGVPRDDALRRAQADLAAQGDFAHPFHWAAFVLVGAGD
ncbi:MAG: tetratricopeptide repeat protein [Acidobacteria bacterium]|nr:tetratricopeptide repeat protein [Acidobacteriota bacterium]